MTDNVWISVKDKLPEESNLYLTNSRYGADLLYWDSEEKLWHSMGHKLADGEVWHWMPIPEPPET